jgi:glycosyltransferase involved in cell wall biosynthesis
VSERTSPLVSIVIPVYNGARYVGEAISTTLSQEGVELEIIVSDNASDDGTADVVAGFDDPRIAYRRNETNLGAVPNWNLGMERATGEYVKLLCADDVLYPGCLARQVAALEAHPEAAFTCGPHDVIDEAGERVMSRGFARPGLMPAADVIHKMARSGTNLVGEPSNVLIRTSAYRAVGPWDEGSRYCVDQDLWFRLLLVGDLVVTEGPLSAFRVQRGSWSNRLADRQTSDVRDLLQRVAGDPRYGVSGGEVTLGTFGAWRNTQLRKVFYALFLRAPSGSKARA